MRKIICVQKSWPVPDNARPIGVCVEKVRHGNYEILEETHFYYDIPVEEPKDEKPQKKGIKHEPAR